MLHAVGHCGLAGLARDFNSLGLQGIFANQAILHGGVKNLIQHHLGLVLGGLGPVHAVKQPLNVIGGNVLHGQAAKGGEQVLGELPLVGGGGHGLDVGLGVGLKPGCGVVGKRVLSVLLGVVLWVPTSLSSLSAYSTASRTTRTWVSRSS